MQRLAGKSFIVILIFLLAACNSNPPKDTLTLAIDDYIESQRDELVYEIKNASKKNGYVLNDIYHLEIEYELHYLISLDQVVELVAKKYEEDTMSEIKENPFAGGESVEDKIFAIAMMKTELGKGILKKKLIKEIGYDFSPGDIVKEQATIRLIKTENGWQVYDE